jgi:2-oxoglutarate ferredoxin oxidoreductase subunit delta
MRAKDEKLMRKDASYQGDKRHQSALEKGKDMSKGVLKVVIDREMCKGCGLCVEACPHGLIHILLDEMNAKGYQPAAYSDPEGKCTSCAMCAMMCPDIAITIYAEEKSKA